ncbi:MAG: DUF4384 domain-containing protein [Ignavibacteriales bacterium]|nr:DUF4384 domain-containing protein [Ignavibacteriales bacterium]
MRLLFIPTLAVFFSGAGVYQPAGIPESAAEFRQDDENVVFRWGFGALLGKEKTFVSITRDTTLRTGDEIKMVVELRKDCFVYVIHHSPKGEVTLLFPEDVRQFAGDYKVGKNYYIPKGRGWFELDAQLGRETFYLLASHQRLLELEAMIGNYQSAEESGKAELADKVLAEIRTVKRKFRTFTTLAERPVTIGGNIRGVEKAEEARRPDIAAVTTEISASNFFSKTFTIDHQ